jgi:putative DNA primase/helicase
MPDLNEKTVKEILEEQKAAPDPGKINLTDLGNARRLVFRHGQNIQHCTPLDKWFIWGGVRWGKDETGEIIRFAKDTAMSIWGEIQDAFDGDKRKKIADWANKSESDRSLRAMMNLTKSEPGIPVLPSQLDTAPMLLNCMNGILDLRTAQLFPHNRKDLITKLVPIAYDSEAKCQAWDAFLDRIMKGNADLIAFIRRAVGYSLTGDTSEQCFFILHGSGANGKSTFIEAVRGVLAEYASTAEFSTFLIHKSEMVRNDLAKLVGTRFVSSVESKRGRRLDESLIKSVTGQDMITARFLFKEYFDYSPSFKLWLATNHKPKIDGADTAIWRRIRLIPFEVTIPPKEQDKTLPERLKEEWPGILAWAVKGALDWQEVGLHPPYKVQKATRDYQNEMDVLSGFLSEHCVIDQIVEVPATELYEAYESWCKEEDESAMPKNEFGKALNERGFKVRKSMNTRIRCGIRLKTEADKQQAEDIGTQGHTSTWNSDTF